VEPPTLRVNTRRAAEERVVSKLNAQGFRLERIPGLPPFFRVLEEPYPISRTLEHWLGLFYLQQAATGAAALALGPERGERILDLCAAPGGKTSHIAELMRGSGLVVAGENNPGRVRALLGNLYRLGHTGVLSLSSDGRTFPGGALFDRALVDVPCSGEGNARRRRGSYSATTASDSFRGHVTGVQRALLKRAVELVRPGGTILYVTCTSAVEENEAVVARALRRLPVSLEPIDLDLPHAPGLVRHGARAFPGELELAWRLGPEHVGSGNLFMARLRREHAPLEDPSESVPARHGWRALPRVFVDRSAAHSVSDAMLEEALDGLHHEMGVSREALSEARWMIRGDSVWLHEAPDWPVDAWTQQPLASSAAGWRVVSLGLRAFRQESSGRLRVTNDLLRFLDGSLHDQTVELSRGEALELLSQGESRAGHAADGYVALRVEGGVIGRGFVRSGRLRSEVPRPHAKLLAEALAFSLEAR
jgi:16S rRNA C967 or C1407 C5-methylase (RsmB/RsmF family)